MAGVLAGEVQQYVDGRWRTVLTAGGIPVVDRRRHNAPVGPPPVFVDVFDNGVVRARQDGQPDMWGWDWCWDRTSGNDGGRTPSS